MILSEERHILEAFLLDNPPLEKLESLISEFNIFDAIGMAHQELRHSHFLAYLLNPNESHGLGDRFLKRFLMRVLVDGGDAAPFSAIEIDIMDLGDAQVERETDHIDILIHDTANKFICVIENKIYSGEHDDQLARYMRSIRKRFPSPDNRVLPVFLTPDGEPASDDRYLPFSYVAVIEEIERLRSTHTSTIGPDVNTAMRHYATMLGRHIVTDSEIAQLCQQIYQRHKAAIDLIIEHIPSTRSAISDFCATLVDQSAELRLEKASISAVRFVHTDWDQIPALNEGTGWAKSNAMMTFAFHNYPDTLTLLLWVGPGSPVVRQTLLNLAMEYPNIFRSKKGENHTSIYRYPILTKADYPNSSYEELVQKIEKRWEVFRSTDLVAIQNAVRSLQFPNT